MSIQVKSFDIHGAKKHVECSHSSVRKYVKLLEEESERRMKRIYELTAMIKELKSNG